MNTLNTRISLKTDSKSRWETALSSQILLKGEVAIAMDGTNPLFKIGDGENQFYQLPYVNQTEVKTKLLKAKMILAKNFSQGFQASSTPLGFAAGLFLSANANFSQALGCYVETAENDDFSFAWNGDDSNGLDQTYTSHGKGTFNINPISGLDGFYVGDFTLQDYLDEYVKNTDIATIAEAGLVKSSSSSRIDSISVDVDGIMSVNDLNAKKLYQSAGDYIVLNGGNA